MANEIRTKLDARATFTISLASLANSAVGVGRQSTMISNSSNRPGALIFVKIRSGSSTPTAGAVFQVYLLRGDGTSRTDGAGSSDAGLTVENADLLGTIVVIATTGKDFYGVFDTAPLGRLGTEFGIAVVNASGTALDSTGGNHVCAYQLYADEVQ
ncbi:MAG: hypothetical protein ACKVRP_14600 [Bacteroidota bacterium]